MRRYALIALFSVFLLTSCTKGTDVAVGLYAPDFKVTSLKTGDVVSSSQLRGKVLFVNFWATWCPPCREEVPSIQALYQEMQSQPDFMMITVLYNDNPASAMEYLRSNGYSFPVYNDSDSRTSRKFGITGVPETYIVDKKGILKKKVIGGDDWNSTENKELIYALLKK